MISWKTVLIFGIIGFVVGLGFTYVLETGSRAGAIGLEPAGRRWLILLSIVAFVLIGVVKDAVLRR